VIDFGINKAANLSTSDFMQEKQRCSDKMITLVTTNNPNNPQMHHIVKNTIDMLNASKTMEKVMSKTKYIHAKRQPPNLKRILTTDAFTDKQECHTVKTCGQNCETCKILIEGPSINFTVDHEQFIVKYNFSCTTKNVIYVIICNNYKAEYIGESGNELKTRMTVHRQQIRDSNLRTLKVSKHIYTCGKGFSVYPFYKLHSNASASDRRQKEYYFIKKYKPVLNAD
jgi:ferredoxin